MRHGNIRRPRPLPFTWPWLAPFVLFVAACDRGATTFFPLDAERYWQYTVRRTTMDGTVTQKYLIATEASSRDWNGTSVRAKRTVDGSEYYYRVDDTGVMRVAQKLRSDADVSAADPAVMVLPANPSVGASWRQPTFTSVLENTGPPWETLFRITKPVTLDYVIESTSDTVDVPAGRFSGCVRAVGNGRFNADVGNYIGRTDINVRVTDWYAPDVGLVRSERIETTSADALNYGALVMELEVFR